MHVNMCGNEINIFLEDLCSFYEYSLVLKELNQGLTIAISPLSKE